MDREVVNYLLIPLGVIVITLIIREIVCWYWKINRRVANLEKISSTLDEISKKLDELKNK